MNGDLSFLSNCPYVYTSDLQIYLSSLEIKIPNFGYFDDNRSLGDDSDFVKLMGRNELLTFISKFKQRLFFVGPLSL